jgi:hypothetical protein
VPTHRRTKSPVRTVISVTATTSAVAAASVNEHMAIYVGNGIVVHAPHHRREDRVRALEPSPHRRRAPRDLNHRPESRNRR